MTNYHILISDTPSGESESSKEEEEEGGQGHASRPTNGPEQEDAGGLSAAERSDAIADRIRKRRTQGRQFNYREGSQDSESEEEPPRQRKRTRRAEATASTASGENKFYYIS